MVNWASNVRNKKIDVRLKVFLKAIKYLSMSKRRLECDELNRNVMDYFIAEKNNGCPLYPTLQGIIVYLKLSALVKVN
jgi:hypothetical protein